jgi:hypothetical protein
MRPLPLAGCVASRSECLTVQLQRKSTRRGIGLRLTNWTLLANGTFQLAYASSSGRTGNVYASTNLTNWAATGTATQVSTGLFQFTDSTATNYPRRFYQLRSP